MAGKTMIGGVAYDIKAGKTMIGGVAYDIKAGKTLVDGVAYDIKLGGLELILSGATKFGSTAGAWVELNGTIISDDGTYPLTEGDSLKIYLAPLAGSRKEPNRILLNGTQVASGYGSNAAEYTLTVESSASVVFTSVSRHWIATVTTS